MDMANTPEGPGSPPAWGVHLNVSDLAATTELGMRYSTCGAGDDAVAGICDASSFLPARTTSYWRFYLGVADADVSAASIVENGGQVLDGPEDSPFGRFATVADPQGAQFQINAG